MKKDVPFVLVGSIRDDGPLPEVYANVYEGQDAMRDCVRKATTVICMATTLHSIATGNMTPSFRVMPDGTIRQVYFYSVDVSEFAVNKLGDRGSLSAKKHCDQCTGLCSECEQGPWPVEAGIRSFSGRNYENDMVMNGHPELLWFRVPFGITCYTEALQQNNPPMNGKPTP